ncbi:MAG: tripartite tricarboxylate transporter substrate binding protein, partial [Pseudomonadota bacterium]
MFIKRSLLVLCALAAGFACLPVVAQVVAASAAPGAFPVKPVRFINPFPAGSGPDAVARVVGEKLGRAWSQPVVVENRPG